jgi:probable rRNA maturation factor
MPSARTLARFLREAQAAVRLRGMVSVLLTTDGAMRRLNRTFRGKNKATDVLSFPAGEASRGEVAGDLAISIPTARKQAAEQGHSLSAEVKVLMLHGMLHLAGYDHETDDGKMERRERVLRARLGLPLGLIERSMKVPASRGSSLPTLAPEKRRKDGARKVVRDRLSTKRALASSGKAMEKTTRGGA